MLKKILILISILISGYSYSQELNGFEKESRLKADLVFNKTAESQSKNHPYLLISVANSNYLIIVDRKTHYTRIKVQLTPSDSIEITSVKSIKKPNKILEIAFNKSIYSKDFIGFESDFFKSGYEESWGGTTYFVMKDETRKRYGESSLSVIIKPNPIDEDVYGYLINELIFNE